jgi:hypothetical protein
VEEEGEMKKGEITSPKTVAQSALDLNDLSANTIVIFGFVRHP